jgi:hypothetical protein
MKKSMVISLTGLALVLAQCGMALAQASSQPGMFGNRFLGQPLAPQPSSFGGGIQLGPAGNFVSLGRPNGATSFPLWKQYSGAPIDLGVAASPPAQPAAQLSPPRQPPAGGVPAVQVGQPAQPPANSPQESVGAAPGGTTPPTWDFAVRRGGSGVDAAAARGEPLVRSPVLSDRLTRIARTKNMLAGRGIDVYLRGDTALVQGAVRTSGDRALLANVVRLEPDVSRIDNQLTVPGADNYYYSPGTPR